ncbi:DNA polymerase III subunit alpha [Nicoliella lavandulae]|uniref:DNA polymerase III subunit alpha n=1 Tax=Nicoliella lavandulae TaxID=3082954 RepID=A0ABU8SM75_9LACO
MGFVPLQIVSSYSLLQSTISITKLVQTAKQRGYQSLALTDRNVMYGAVEFYNQCKQAGIHAIIGTTLSIPGIVNPNQNHDLILLAQSQAGYQNLMRLSTAKMTEQPVDLGTITDYLNDLVIILPTNGELLQLVERDEQTAANQVLKTLLKYVKAADLKVGVSPAQDQVIIDQLYKLAAEHGIGSIGIEPVEYIDSDDYFATQVLKSIDDPSAKVAVSEQNKPGRNWLKPVEMVEREYHLKHMDTALNATNEIAERCNVTIQKQPTQLPSFATPHHQSSKQYLNQLCQSGLKRRLAENKIPDEMVAKYQDRLAHELSIIGQMGFDDYFLIVWDVINYAHSVDIMTGPGRGSAAGSLVAYVLSITDVDPIAYDLLFERFLNPERAQMPDIDLDIPDNRRDDVLNYVHDKYGHDRVAQIITFDTLGAKQVLRDINRAFGVSSEKANQWSKAIPNQLHITLAAAYQQSPGLQNIVNTDAVNQLVFKTALKLEGLPRHFSTHAAGVILSAEPLVNMSPLQLGKDNLLMTQYSKNYAEEVGLLKIDFLGLRNLSLLAAIVKLVRANRNPEFDVHQINVNDPKTLVLFQNGDTNGIFQFESDGIKNVLRQVHPDNFNLVAVVDALYRPGPMQNISSFVKRKNGQEAIHYPDQSLAPILAPTYGIIVYQEQVMQVAAVMGGFSFGQADVLRRAMSKKDQAKMDAMRTKFLAGAKQRGFSASVANTTFDYIDRFADYGFNKSHAVAYSKMAFQLAYLKVHYPREFFVAIFNAELGNKAKTRTFLLESKRRQIEIMPPDINVSQREFSLQNNAIVFGLAAIRGLRSDFITDLLQIRSDGGPFTSFESLLHRIDAKFRKTSIIEPLIYAGALDCFGFKRAELMASLPEFLESINLSGSSMELFKALQPKMKFQDEFSLPILLENEQKYLGVYLSNYPTENYLDVIQAVNAKRVDEVNQLINQKVNLVLFINHVREIRTKKGESMAFATGSDPIGELDIVIFPQVFKQVQPMLKAQRVLLINGKIENRNGLQIVANQIEPAANFQQRMRKHQQSDQHPEICFLKVDADHEHSECLNQLKQLIVDHPGNCPILIYWAQRKSKQMLGANVRISNQPVVEAKLKQLLGAKNVVFQKR